MAKLEERKCQRCGKVYMPTHWSSKFCGEECRYEHKKEQIKLNNKKAYEKFKKEQIKKRCVICRKTFKTVRSDVVTCSPYCQEIRHKEYMKKYNKNKRDETKKKKEKTMSIAEFDREARKMGMSYGQYDLYLRLHGKEKKSVI